MDTERFDSTLEPSARRSVERRERAPVEPIEPPNLSNLVIRRLLL